MRDLLDHPEELPENVLKIIETFEELTYSECRRIKTELEKVGYTVNYDLSGELYDLQKLT